MKQKIFHMLRSFAILYLILYLGEWMAYFIPVGIPGSIWGLLLLFIGLVANIIKVNWIFMGASLLIRYMAILFVPVSVGIIKYSDLLLAQINALLIPNIISTGVTLVIFGFFSDYLFRSSSFSNSNKKRIKEQIEEK